MPVTAKLSRQFYERLGDDVATELVEWFNLLDATYRSDLRELNHTNFARFDAKLEQRVAQLEARMNEGFARADVRLEQRIAELRAAIAERIGAFESRLSYRLLAFWIAQAATTVALVFGVVKVLQH